jgi:hypothetical protein
MTISTESFVTVNVGTSANDGTGDDLRAAFTKVNDNYSNISTKGFNSGNIDVTGSIEASGNITAAFFSGDGSGLTGVVGTYDDTDVTTFLPTYSGNVGSLTSTGNLTIEGSTTRKVENRGQTNAPITTTIDMSTGGDELLLIKANSNIELQLGGTITSGRQVDVTVNNESGTNYFVVLDNAQNNTGDANVSIPDGTWTRFVFTAFGTDSANVGVAITGQ